MILHFANFLGKSTNLDYTDRTVLRNFLEKSRKKGK